MDSILIEFFTLNLLIERMKNLKLTCDAKGSVYPAIQGGGATAAQLEALTSLYGSLANAISLLIANTTAALENARDTMANTDKAIAAAIRAADGLKDILS